MHPRVHETYQKLAEKYEMKGPFLEVGVGNREAAILSGNYFLGKPERFATNLSDKEILEEQEAARIRFIKCNSNDMREVFADGQFGTVLSNAVIEHDKYFWRSLDEMKRVLAPGGILAIGAPAYVPRSQLKSALDPDRLTKATITMDVHSAPDYWRFSRMAFREVICEGLEILEICLVGRVPVLVAVARKPLDGLAPPVAQEDRLQVYHAEKDAKADKRETNAQKRAAKLQEREAKKKVERPANDELKAAARPAKGNPAKEARLQKRAERLQSREAKLARRQAKAVAEAPAEPDAGVATASPQPIFETQAGQAAALPKGKIQRLLERAKSKLVAERDSNSGTSEY